jgi:hypothetical protein
MLRYAKDVRKENVVQEREKGSRKPITRKHKTTNAQRTPVTVTRVYSGKPTPTMYALCNGDHTPAITFHLSLLSCLSVVPLVKQC